MTQQFYVQKYCNFLRFLRDSADELHLDSVAPYIAQLLAENDQPAVPFVSFLALLSSYQESSAEARADIEALVNYEKSYQPGQRTLTGFGEMISRFQAYISMFVEAQQRQQQALDQSGMIEDDFSCLVESMLRKLTPELKVKLCRYLGLFGSLIVS